MKGFKQTTIDQFSRYEVSSNKLKSVKGKGYYEGDHHGCGGVAAPVPPGGEKHRCYKVYFPIFFG